MAKKKEIQKEKPMTPEMVQMANAKISDLLAQQNFGSIEEANEFFKQHINGKKIDDIVFNKKGKKSDVEKSEDLIYQAYESSPAKGLKLAKEALTLDPENIRAINFIADKEDNIEIAKILYKQSIEIGIKKLGEKYFQENKGHFWGLHETRPFMTAKLNYADCLNSQDKTEEAIKEYFELLELNPNDNQGVRYILSGLLLHKEKYKDYLMLYNSNKSEQSTFWLFNYALFLFITKGESKEADKALQAANNCNNHVIQFMTQQKQMTSFEIPEYYSPGEEDEAKCYLMDNFSIWRKHKESIFWLMKYSKLKDKFN